MDGMIDQMKNLAPAALMAIISVGGSGSLPARAAEKPAKILFGKVAAPADVKPAVYGSYTRGCLAGAAEMPQYGPAWQVMRPKRNRNWGHPKLIEYALCFPDQRIERFSEKGISVYPGKDD